MAYNLLATIKFMSLNGTPCEIDVFKDGYYGQVWNLSTEQVGAYGYPADDPFYYEEDNSHDLLKFLRVKTGYIRLVETGNDSLSFMYPTREREIYVRVYYGAIGADHTENLVFTGYIQCAEYSADWTAPPNIREFPVVSPLGMAASKAFTTKTPQLLTMGSVMAEIMEGLSMDYQYVIYPGGRQRISGTDYAEDYPFNGKIHSLAVSPFNNEWGYDSEAADLYTPQTFDWFLNGLCNCKGWMLHDTPTALVFTSFDFADYYDRVTLAQLKTTNYADLYFLDNSTTRKDLEDFFTLCGDDGKQTESRSVKRIDIKVDGVGVYNQVGTPKYINQVHTSVSEEAADHFVKTIMGTNVGPQMVSNYWLGIAGGLYPGGYAPAADVEDSELKFHIGSPSPAWIFKYYQDMSGIEIMRFRFFGPVTSSFTGKLLLKMNVKIGPNLYEMKLPFMWRLSPRRPFDFNNFGFNTAIYVNGTEVAPIYPSPTPQTLLQWAANCTDVDGSFFYPLLSSETRRRVINSIDVAITGLSGLDAGWYFQLEVSVIDPSDYTNSYYRSEPKGEFVRGWSDRNDGNGEKSLQCAISDYAAAPSANTFGDKDGWIKNQEPPAFDYMFTPQIFLELPMEKNLTPLPTNLYLPRYTYWKDDDYHWRIIGDNFHLRDDEHKLTLAHTDNITPAS